MTWLRRRWWRVLLVLAGVIAWVSWFVLAGLGSDDRTLFLVWLGAILLIGLGLGSREPRQRVAGDWILPLLIIAAAMLLRWVGLETVPFLVTRDEIIFAHSGRDLFRIFEDPWTIISGAQLQYLSFFAFALQAWPALFLDPLLGTRVATWVQALLSLIGTYLLGKRLYGRSVGLVALLLLAGSFWHHIYSRMGYPYLQPVVVAPWAMLALLRGFDGDRPWLQYVGGLLLGASLLLYAPARILVPIALAWIGWRWLVRRGQRRSVLVGLLSVLVGVALFVTPYVYEQTPEGLVRRFRFSTTNPRSPSYRLSEGDYSLETIATVASEQLHNATKIFYSSGAHMAVNDFQLTPLVDPLTLVLALVGLLLVLWRMRRGGDPMLLLWVLAPFVAGQLLTDIPQSAYRAAPMMPALALAAGLAAVRWSRLVSGRRRLAWLGGPAALVVLIMVVGLFNYRYLMSYFRRAERAPVATMGRILAAGDRTFAYYVVNDLPVSTIMVPNYLADGRLMLDATGLMDVLGRAPDPRRNAMFILHPNLVEAAAAIRRCYPGARRVGLPAFAGGSPPQAWLVSARAVALGKDCEVSSEGPGLRARYFTGENLKGEVVLERLEDFPYRWPAREQAFPFASIEWTGRLRAPVTGEYIFEAPAGVEASVAGVPITPGPAAKVALAAGDHDFVFRCLTPHRLGCVLLWRMPGGDIEMLPPRLLFPPRSSPSSAAEDEELVGPQ